MSKTVFIGACYPENILDKFITQHNIREVSAYVFGWNLVRGLRENGKNIFVINEHKGIRFPRGKLFVPCNTFNYNSIMFYNYKYLNISYFDRLSKAVHIYKLLTHVDPSQIIVYSLHTPYLYPAVKFAKKYDRKIIVVIPDLPQYMFAKSSLIRNILKRIDCIIIKRLLKKCDGYVVLTENMVKALNLSKPYTVVEGIAISDTKCGKKANNKKYILYAGGLNREYGIDVLVQAFMQADTNDCELWLCGEGDYVDEIKSIGLIDSRIVYKGFLNRQELKELRDNALLLVNPRNAADDYTKYSFPSKTMEYLSSGVPVMMEKLDGIPEEYYSYIIEVKNQDWKEAIEKYLKLPEKAIKEIGESGREFVKNNKNAKTQCKKICCLLEEIQSESFGN